MIKKRVKGNLMIEICIYALFILLMIKSGNYVYSLYQNSKFNLVISEIRIMQMDFLITEQESKKLSCGAIMKKADNKIIISDENNLGFFSLIEANKIKNSLDNIKLQESENGKYLILMQ